MKRCLTATSISNTLLTRFVVTMMSCLLAGCAENDYFMQDMVQDAAPRTTGCSPDADTATDTSIKGALALARLSERRHQTDQARQLYRAAIERDPHNATPHHRLGVLCARAGKFREAEEHFAEAVHLAQDNPQLLSDIGYTYYLQHRLDEAESALRQAFELKPDDPAILNNLAMTVGEKGRYAESLALFQRAGNPQQAYANLAFVYTQRGEVAQAKAWYSRALTEDKTLRPAAEAMIQLARYEEPAGRSPSEQTHLASHEKRTESAARLPPVATPPQCLETHPGQKVARLSKPQMLNRPVSFNQPDPPMARLGQPLRLTGIPAPEYQTPK